MEDVGFISRDIDLEVSKNFLIPGLQSVFKGPELLIKNELRVTFNSDVPSRIHQVFEGGVTYPHFLKLKRE